MKYSIYFAGDLFDHKHLAGNVLLAQAIEELSDGKFTCVLPQDFEQVNTTPVGIRNADLRGVFTADLALFNFDGADLDSGTVAEFMFAKTLDIPSVLLRTDFRNGGDQEGVGDPWNLMLSGYPRTESLPVHGMALYQETLRKVSKDKLLESYYQELGKRVVVSLEKALATPKVATTEAQMWERVRTALALAGSGFAEMFSDEELRRLVARRLA